MSLNKSQALSIAKEYMLQRNVRAAIAIYREIIEADPTDLTAINTLGDLCASTGLVQDAITQFSRVADSYIESGFTRKAIATLKKIIAADPANTETAIKLADMYARAGLPSEARQHYLQIAGDYTRKGEALEALRVFSKIVDLDPSNPSTRIKLGELCLSAGINDQAYEAFVTAAEQLTNKGEIRRALNAYNEALSIRPDNAGTLAAVYKLSNVLGADPDKVMRGVASQSAASGNLAQENSPTLTASDQLPAPTAFHHRPESSDDLFVVQETSKAERLVAHGQVNQAIAMLNTALRYKPDNIDLHIKLKDICLRTGMMAEAAQECGEIARIHQARGEHDRARDYAVRANRLMQLIEKPSGDLQQPEQKPVEDAEPRFNTASIKLATPPEPKPTTRQITSEPDVDRAQPARITLSVVPPVAISPEAAIIAADPPPALHSDDAQPSPLVSEAKLESDLAHESAFDEATNSSTDEIESVLPSLFSDTLPVERSGGRLTTAAIAAIVLAVGLAGAVIGGFAYDSHLNKQYEALALAAPPRVEPSSLPEPLPESQPIEETEPIIVEVTPSLQTETSPLIKKPEPVIKNEQPATPQPISEPLKVISRPSPLPPRIVVNPDSQAYIESRIPAGLAGDVPVTPTHPAEPPPKAVRRSTGVVSGAAVKKVDPVYPKAAREAQQTGVVAVEITINEQGNVSSARALSGPALLRNAAVLAARAWKFKPSLLGGVPVTTTSTITFNFKL